MAYRHMRECSRAMKSMLYNEITNEYEEIMYGVEYISPNQHGQLFNHIYRKYYQIPPTTGSPGDDILIPLGFVLTGDIIDYSALIKHGDNRYKLPYRDNECYININNMNIQIVNADSLIIDGGHAWVDYTK